MVEFRKMASKCSLSEELELDSDYQQDHTTSEEDERENESDLEDIIPESDEKLWTQLEHLEKLCREQEPELFTLTEKAKQRFMKGPSKLDTTGYIYIYRNRLKTVADFHLFKIGKSKDPEARIKQTRRNTNKIFGKMDSSRRANYILEGCFKTDFYGFTEDVIHKQLESCNNPQQFGDGKTEWYCGRQEWLEKCIKEVNSLVKKSTPHWEKIKKSRREIEKANKEIEETKKEIQALFPVTAAMDNDGAVNDENDTLTEGVSTLAIKTRE